MANLMRNMLRKGAALQAGARARQRGFTLPEVMVALTVITIISIVVIGALGPWLSLKQSIDNDRRLSDLRQGVYHRYQDNAMAVESQAAGTFFGMTNSTVDGFGNCVTATAGFQGMNNYITDSGLQAARDGYGNPLCVFVSNQLSSVQEGTTLYFRNIAIVSPGRDGKMEPDTRMNVANGTITFHGDDIGFVVSGYEIQHGKLRETLLRMSRIANTYEAYFSTRFLSYPDRDITRNHFSRTWDSSGSVASTGGAWQPALTLLGAIGVSPSDAYSAWETNNQIMVGNHTEAANGVQVRSPATTGVGRLPYSALVTAQIPSPAGAGPAYVTRVAVGNY